MLYSDRVCVENDQFISQNINICNLFTIDRQLQSYLLFLHFSSGKITVYKTLIISNDIGLQVRPVLTVNNKTICGTYFTGDVTMVTWEITACFFIFLQTFKNHFCLYILRHLHLEGRSNQQLNHNNSFSVFWTYISIQISIYYLPT